MLNYVTTHFTTGLHMNNEGISSAQINIWSNYFQTFIKDIWKYLTFTNLNVRYFVFNFSPREWKAESETVTSYNII